MRARVQIFAVVPAHGAQLVGVRRPGIQARGRGFVFIFFLGFFQGLLEIRADGGHFAGVAEKIFGAHEEPAPRALGPHQLETLRQGAQRRQSLVDVHALSPHRDRADGAGQPLQQGGFAAAVIPHEKCDRGLEIQPGQGLDDGHVERKFVRRIGEAGCR